MSILNRLKRLFKKKEEEEQVENKEEELVAPKIISEQAEHNESIPIDDTYHAIKTWEKTLEAAKQHPLSQVKILNTQILEELTNVLKHMNHKLDKLDKLDDVLMLLHETREELNEKGIESSKIDEAIEEIERLTIKDKEVVSWIAKQGRVTAKQLADYTGLSRSTASFRLNRLAEIGVLEKEAVGKKIFYKTKNI